MSGKIKILGLVCAAALAILLAGISLGAPPDDPCGGHYVGEGLKAVFSSSYYEDGNPVPFDCNIFNDLPGYYYQYQVSGGDCVFLFRAGHIVVGVNKDSNNPYDRYVNMRFLGNKLDPGDSSCGNAYFMDNMGINGARAAGFTFRTTGGFVGSRDDNNELVLTSTGVRLNFGAMSPGQTLYCSIWVTFSVVDDPDTIDVNEALDSYDLGQQPVKVYYGLRDNQLKWVITPITEDYWIYTVTKKGKTITTKKTEYPGGTLYRDIISNGRIGCNHGTFYFPFELILER
jgi:hypothetical protein